MYKLITVSGPDAIEFLQGQLTQDVSRLTDEEPMLAAWCNPKGRVIVVVRLVALDDAIGLVVPAAMADDIVRRLTMYRFRSKVEFHVGELPADLLSVDDTDPSALIRAGIPTIDASNTEAFTPHMLNLDKLGAISFDKGCYTGQEVVARTENLGKSKRRLMRFSAEVDGVATGDRVSDGERNIGEVVNVTGRELLAVAPVDLHDKTLKSGNSALVPQGLPYAI